VIAAAAVPAAAERGNWSGAFRRERFYTGGGGEVEHLDFSIHRGADDLYIYINIYVPRVTAVEPTRVIPT